MAFVQKQLLLNVSVQVIFVVPSVMVVVIVQDGQARGHTGDAEGTTSYATVSEYDEVVAEQVCRTTLSQFVPVYIVSKVPRI